MLFWKRSAVLIILFLSCLTANGQTSLSFASSVGGGVVKFHWPYGSIAPDVKPALSFTLAIRARTRITPKFSWGSELGVMRAFANVNLDFDHSGSGNTSPYKAEIFGIDYQLAYAYLFVFPEFHPFNDRILYLRAFPVIKLEIKDRYDKDGFGGFSGIMTDTQTSSVNYEYDHFSNRRHHPLLFFLDVGADIPLPSLPAMSLFFEVRLCHVFKSNYFKTKSTSRELDYPDNLFWLISSGMGLSYNL